MGRRDLHWQGNLGEKSLVVPKMQRIYVDALRVTVWLGPEDDDSQDVLPRIKSYTQQSISKEDFKALDQTVVGRLLVGRVNISLSS
jgi:hypothetical protein